MVLDLEEMTWACSYNCIIEGEDKEYYLYRKNEYTSATLAPRLEALITVDSRVTRTPINIDCLDTREHLLSPESFQLKLSRLSSEDRICLRTLTNRDLNKLNETLFPTY